MKNAIYYIAFITGLFIACEGLIGEEIARTPINRLSNPDFVDWRSMEADLKAGDKIYFWTDMDIEYEGEYLENMRNGWGRTADYSG